MSFCKFASALLLGLLVAGPFLRLRASAPTADYRWNSVSIQGGGFVTGLAFHPVEPGLLYARTDVGGAFRWAAPEHRWIPLNDALGRDQAECAGIVSLALDPHDADRVYLAAGSYLPAWAQGAALLASSDRGATWTMTALPFRLGGNADGRSTGERLQVDPNDGAILFLGTNRDGLWRSGDRGRTWQHLAGLPPASLTFVLFDPSSAPAGEPTQVIYAGSNDLASPSLYASTDAGVTWLPVAGQPIGLIPHHAAFDSAGLLYLTYSDYLGPNDVTNGAVWKFDPAGKSWTNITPAAPNRAGQDTFGYAGLAVDPHQPGVLIVSTLDRWHRGDELFRTTDGGATWAPLLASSTWDHAGAPYTIPIRPHWIGDVALDPSDPRRVWFVTGCGVWATAALAGTGDAEPTRWEFADDGLEETVVEELVSPPSGATLLSALADIGGFRHEDLRVPPVAGAWSPPHGSNPGLDFAAAAPAKLVRTHSGPTGGAWSADGGSSWHEFASAPPTAASHGPGKIAIAADGARIVWQPKKSVPWYSSDDGATWTPSQGAFLSAGDYHMDAPVADRVDPRRFYLYDQLGGRIYASTDGGATFAAAAGVPLGGGRLRASPDRAGDLWLPTSNGLYHSINAGRVFGRLPGVDEAYQLGFGHAAPGRARPVIFLHGRIGGITAIFRSDDSGATWLRLSDDAHRFGWINVVAGDAQVFGRVYLGTGGRGIVYGEPRPE